MDGRIPHLCPYLDGDSLFRLGVDPRKGDQTVRGTCELPHNNGKKTTILFVCTSEANKQAARENGADMVVDSDILENIKNGKIVFTKLYATHEGLNLLKPHARILGPLGLFPNLKAETLFAGKDTAQVIQQAKRGKIEFRVDMNAQLLLPIARISYADKVIEENLSKLLHSLVQKKPEKLKGSYIQKILIKSSFGDYWRLHVPYLDPRSPSFQLERMSLS